MIGWGCPVYGGVGGGGWSVLGMLSGSFIFLGALLVIVVVSVWLTRRGRLLGAKTLSGKGGVDPLSIAQRRLAAGELSTEEFEEIRNRIQE